MAMTSRRWPILAAAAALAAVVPVVALLPASVVPPAPRAGPIPVQPAPLPAASRVYDRPLFSLAEPEAAPADAPELTGIAGRIDRDAVALVRLQDGSARTLAIGESVDGWRLESLAIDAALFTRGRERVRVALASEPAPAD